MSSKTIKPSNSKTIESLNIHLIGIGGTGMNGLANCLIARGYQVSGSDNQSSPVVQQLRSKGIKVYLGHHSDNLKSGTQLVVKSAAIRDDNPELIKAERLKIPVVKYSEMLGCLMRDKYGIAIAGCHGKTTTSAMIAWLLSRARLDPSFVIGGYVTDLSNSAYAGKGKYFVAEACEYDRSFLNLSYRIAVINNIEADHLDYYRDLTEIKRAFRTFASRIPKDGFIIANADDPNVRRALKDIKHKIIWFGLTGAHRTPHNAQRQVTWTARNIARRDNKYHFTVYHTGRKYADFTLKVLGIHNIYNALSAIAVADLLEINKSTIKKSLGEFSGVARRFQTLGAYNGALVIDDYGHHPTEIRAVLGTARAVFPQKRLWTVFQPHQASRTRLFLADFARAFTIPDKVILPDIYFARDSAAERRRITSKDLAREINKRGGDALYLPSFALIIKYLKKRLTENDVVITMGAGDVWKIAHQLITYN